MLKEQLFEHDPNHDALCRGCGARNMWMRGVCSVICECGHEEEFNE